MEVRDIPDSRRKTVPAEIRAFLLELQEDSNSPFRKSRKPCSKQLRFLEFLVDIQWSGEIRYGPSAALREFDRRERGLDPKPVGSLGVGRATEPDMDRLALQRGFRLRKDLTRSLKTLNSEPRWPFTIEVKSKPFRVEVAARSTAVAQESAVMPDEILSSKRTIGSHIRDLHEELQAAMESMNSEPGGPVRIAMKSDVLTFEMSLKGGRGLRPAALRPTPNPSIPVQERRGESSLASVTKPLAVGPLPPPSVPVEERRSENTLSDGANPRLEGAPNAALIMITVDVPGAFYPFVNENPEMIMGDEGVPDRISEYSFPGATRALKPGDLVMPETIVGAVVCYFETHVEVITANTVGVFLAYQGGRYAQAVDRGDAVACLKPAKISNIVSSGLGRFYPYRNDDPVLSHGEAGTWIENYGLPECKPILKRGDRVASGTLVGVVASLFGSVHFIKADIEGIFLEYLLDEGEDVFDWGQPVARIVPLRQT